MKYIIISLIFLISNFSFAKEDYMNGGKIQVLLKDGNKYEFSLDDYMVVPRKAKKVNPELAQPVEEKVIIVEKVEKKKKHIAIVHVGVGKDQLDVKKEGSGYRVTEDDSMVVGVTLCKKQLCATGMSNSTATLGVKVEF
jgi:hypothetical protein